MKGPNLRQYYYILTYYNQNKRLPSSFFLYILFFRSSCERISPRQYPELLYLNSSFFPCVCAVIYIRLPEMS